MATRFRPLSPHLQVYRFTLTMTMSIVHRGTGVALYFGTLLIVLWLGAAALGEAPFALVNRVLSWWPAQAILFLATWALFHHMLGGVRHFVWDSVRALEPASREWIVRIQLIGSVLLTLAAWVLLVWLK
ncbi:MAG: succinate dehydrogenase, cytochrome b556 subunit [Devosia sp.]